MSYLSINWRVWFDTLQSNVTQVKKGCMRYAINWTDVLEPVEFNGNLEQFVNVSWPLEKCTNWEYDTSLVQSSIVIDVSSRYYNIINNNQYILYILYK